MIRPFAPEDMDSVLSIWLTASKQAHSFIDATFWESHSDSMRNVYIPASETYVYESDGVVQGFMSLYGDKLAALFVSPETQGKGIGTLLIKHAQKLREKLSLTVYKGNHAAIEFYKHHGFSITEEQQCEHTSHQELCMHWSAS